MGVGVKGGGVRREMGSSQEGLSDERINSVNSIVTMLYSEGSFQPSRGSVIMEFEKSIGYSSIPPLSYAANR